MQKVKMKTFKVHINKKMGKITLETGYAGGMFESSEGEIDEPSLLYFLAHKYESICSLPAMC